MLALAIFYQSFCKVLVEGGRYKLDSGTDKLPICFVKDTKIVSDKFVHDFDQFEEWSFWHGDVSIAVHLMAEDLHLQV